MEILVGFLIVISLFSSFLPARQASKDEIVLAADATGGTQVSFHQGIKPLKEFTDAYLVKQGYDYSCGSAALATLLNFYLGEDLSEKQVIRGLFKYGDREQIFRRRAFSLLDMKHYVGVLGYKGVGYKASIDDLKTFDMPCIIPVKVFGYEHFVVFKGIWDGHIFFADPWMGNISFTLKKFKDIWYKNVAFVVYPKDGKVLDALMLKEDDLRIVGFDMQRKEISGYIPPLGITDEYKLYEEVTGKGQFYKR